MQHHTTTDRQQRIDQLRADAAEAGISLPVPAHIIVDLEEAGYVLDLGTGGIVELADVRDPSLAATPAGIALVQAGLWSDAL